MVKWIASCLLGLSLSVGSGSLALGATDPPKPIGSDKSSLEQFHKEFMTAKKALDGLVAEVRASDEYKEARKERNYTLARELTGKVTKPFFDEWRARVSKIRKPVMGMEAELPIVNFMLSNRLAENPGELVAEMARTHTKSEQLGLIAASFGRMGRAVEKDEAHKILQSIADQNPVLETRAQAVFSRASMLNGRDATDEDKAQATKLFAHVVEMLPSDHLLSLRAQGPTFAKERLQIGMKVPDIEGVDIDGEKFKLSDYAGKVVMIDFWGDW